MPPTYRPAVCDCVLAYRAFLWDTLRATMIRLCCPYTKRSIGVQLASVQPLRGRQQGRPHRGQDSRGIRPSTQLLRDVVRDRLRHSRILKDEALDRWTEKARRLGCNGESFGYDYLLCAPLDAFDDCIHHCLARHEFEKAAEVVPHTARHGIVKDLVDHQRSKETWVRTSYCDADLTQFGPQRIAQRPHTGFAGAVRSVQRGVDEASHGRDSEKVASLVGDVRHGGFERAPDAVEVNVDRAFPFFWRHARDRSDGATDSSACNDDIQTFEMRRDLGHHLIEVVEVAYVDLPAPGHALAA